MKCVDIYEWVPRFQSRSKTNVEKKASSSDLIASGAD